MNLILVKVDWKLLMDNYQCNAAFRAESELAAFMKTHTGFIINTILETETAGLRFSEIALLHYFN